VHNLGQFFGRKFLPCAGDRWVDAGRPGLRETVLQRGRPAKAARLLPRAHVCTPPVQGSVLPHPNAFFAANGESQL